MPTLAVAVDHGVATVDKRPVYGKAVDAVTEARLSCAAARGVHGGTAWTAVECQWSDD